MAKKNAKKVSSGVNLNGLTFEQLQILQSEIIHQTEVVLENTRQSNLSELKQSGRLQELKVLAKQLQKEIKLFAKGGQFEITLPIRFSMKGEINSEIYSWLEYEDADLRDLINQIVGSYAEDACDDILELMPDNMRAEIVTFMKMFNDLQTEVKKFGLKVSDVK